MAFDLKDLRERKGLSQPELASALNSKWAVQHPDDANHFTVNMIVRMENEPQKVSFEVLEVIAQVFGVTFDQLLKPNIPRLTAPTVKDNWEHVKALQNLIHTAATEPPMYLREKHLELYDHLKELERKTHKPKIACIGRPDSGKSRTLNTLLGRDILPAKWTPTTSTIIYLKHLRDKPSYLGSSTVWIFKDEENDYWDPDLIEDEVYCRKWRLDDGDYSLIEQYGAHNENEPQNIGAVVVFVDSPILYNCDFIDLPGFNPQAIINKGEEARPEDIYDSRDSMLSSRVKGQADGVIYLSIANSFLYGDDLAMARDIVNALPPIEREGENDIPPLGNLFIVASQAATVDHGDAGQLNDICNKAANRVWSLVQGHPSIVRRFETTGYTYSENTLRSRFFTSEMESLALTKQFYDTLVDFVQKLPTLQERAVRKELSAFCENQAEHFDKTVEQLKEQLDSILSDHENAARRLKELEKNEPQRAAAFRNEVNTVTDIINDMALDSRMKCTELYNIVIAPSHIIEVIDERGFKKNKKNLHELVTILNSELENGFTTILTDKSNALKGRIDEFLSDSQRCFKTTISAHPDMAGVPFAFNVTRAFAGGLSGIAAYGALAAWAASCGNLGGYVLVAKTVSVLASIGIHLGGTAAVISAVSAIGGPITLGIAIAAIAAVSSILALGGTWKKLIGNRLVRQYRDQAVLDKLGKTSDTFWRETRDAFRKGAEQVEDNWQKDMRSFRERVECPDNVLLTERLNAEIRSAEETAEFFKTLPERAIKA